MRGDLQPELQIKLNRLREVVVGPGSAVVAFSAGIQSTFLVQLVAEVLGDRCLAVSVSPEGLAKDQDLARWRVAELRVAHRELTLPGAGLARREQEGASDTYYTMTRIYGALRGLAAAEGYAAVFDSLTADNQGPNHPAMLAAREFQVTNPLQAAALTSAEVEELARLLKCAKAPPAEPPHRPERANVRERPLPAVTAAETVLRTLGFRRMRVWHHGEVVRIEVPPEDMLRAVELGREIAMAVQAIGFRYVSLDLMGYSGGINDGIYLPKSLEG